MKNLPTLLFSLSIAVSAFAQNPADSGFTHKAEARNITVNGLKQGKWLEYPGRNDDDISSDTNSPYYILNYYKDGKRIGVSRCYVKGDGSLFLKELHKDGIQNGLALQYYSNGKVETEVNFTDGKPNGVMKAYYQDGKLKAETTFTNGERGDEKDYDDNGNAESAQMKAMREKRYNDSLQMFNRAIKMATRMKDERDSAEAAHQQPAANNDHIGRNDIIEFIDENGTCQQAQLIIVPSDPSEVKAEWQTKLRSDINWQSPSRWLHFKGTDGKSYEIRVEVKVQENEYDFNFISVPMSGEGEEKQHAKLGFHACEGTIWWCQKVFMDQNKKTHFDLGNTRPK